MWQITTTVQQRSHLLQQTNSPRIVVFRPVFEQLQSIFNQRLAVGVRPISGQLFQLFAFRLPLCLWIVFGLDYKKAADDASETATPGSEERVWGIQMKQRFRKCRSKLSGNNFTWMKDLGLCPNRLTTTSPCYPPPRLTEECAIRSLKVLTAETTSPSPPWPSLQHPGPASNARIRGPASVQWFHCITNNV